MEDFTMKNLHVKKHSQSTEKNNMYWQMLLTLTMLELMGTWATCNKSFRDSIFRHKYITKPTVTPEDTIIAEAVNLVQ